MSLLHARDDFSVNQAFRFIFLPSGALGRSEVEELESAFNAPLISSYNASEVSRITMDPLPPGLRKPGTVGVPVICEVSIRSLDGEFVATGTRGEVVVRGPDVFDGYENAPELNAMAFVDGWFRTGDEGFFDEDGYLTLTGRIKEWINRGGEKVSPAEVDAVLMGHPMVSEAATFPVPHPTLGEEVAAVVISKSNSGLTTKELRAYLLERLSGFKTPKLIVFADDIPKSAAGKVQRHKLAETLGVKIGTK